MLQPRFKTVVSQNNNNNSNNDDDDDNNNNNSNKNNNNSNNNDNNNNNNNNNNDDDNDNNNNYYYYKQEGNEMSALEEDGKYKYLGILEADDFKHEKMREIAKKEYFNRLTKLLKSGLNSGNLFSAINTWAVSLFRYGAGIPGMDESRIAGG